MKGAGNVEVSSPVPTETLKQGPCCASDGTVKVVGGAPDQGAKSSSQPNTKGGEIVSTIKSK